MLSKKQLEDAARCLRTFTCSGCAAKHQRDCNMPDCVSNAARTALAYRAMLERLEWILARDKYGEYITRCPDCGEEREKGHAKSCKLAELLEEASHETNT